MTTPPSARQLLTQIGAIQRMEKGTLSSYVPSGRSPGAGPYHKLQCWVAGKNVTRHVRPEELPAIKEALEGYARFQELLQQRVDQIDAAYQPRAEQIRMGRRALRTATLFGQAQIQRDYYYDGQ